MAATDPMDLASAVRAACIQAALDGYEQAQIAGLCQEGAWECAVDAMRTLDLKTIVRGIKIKGARLQWHYLKHYGYEYVVVEAPASAHVPGSVAESGRADSCRVV